MPKSLLQQQERDELVALCMKNAQESIFIADEAGALIEVNEWFLRTLGYDAKDLPSLHVWDIDTNVTEATWPELWRQIPGKTDITFTSYRIAKDGKEIPVKVCKHFVEYKGRKYVFSRSQPTQQTEKDANILPFFEERYQSFINNFQGIAYESTIDWVPVLFKGQVEEMTGYTGEEFLAGTPGGTRSFILTISGKLSHMTVIFERFRGQRWIVNTGLCEKTGPCDGFTIVYRVFLIRPGHL
jgi:PAS domain S-box-containing protein